MATGAIAVATVRPLFSLWYNLHSGRVLLVQPGLMATQRLASVTAGPPMMLISKYQAPASPLKNTVPLDSTSWPWEMRDLAPLVTV
jgi:hypothetical protein